MIFIEKKCNFANHDRFCKNNFRLSFVNHQTIHIRNESQDYLIIGSYDISRLMR